VAEAKAALASAISSLIQAQSNYNRVKPLAAINAVSQSTLDDASAQLAAARAQVNSAEAQLEYAQIQLSYTEIRSPVNGIIGLTRAHIGDYVGIGSNLSILNTVSQIDTILVRFYIPSDRYTSFVQKGEKIKFDDIRLRLSNGQLYPLRGKFDFIGRAVSPSTGSIDVQVSFANPDSVLRPGEFAEISAVVDTIYNCILIPQRALNQLQTSNYVMVVDSSNRVYRREVSIGPKWEQMWVITSGLKSGERIVVEGVHKLKSGMEIIPEQYSTLKNQQNEK
jgi:membrane fusion protein (multidrug efflux system)